MVHKMSDDITRARNRDTAVLSTLVALGIIALLAAAEYVIPRWLHSGAGDSGSFFSSKGSTNGPSATAPPAAPSIEPGANADPSGERPVGRAANPEFPALKSLACQPGDSRCLDRKAHSTARKPSATGAEKPEATAPSSSQNPSASQSTTPAPADRQDARAAEENLRASEDATAHLVALEREDLDHLSDRARSMIARVEAAQKQQPASASQLREDLAFAQQRLQSALSQADTALKNADVLSAQKYMNQAKAELEKLAKLLARR
ncbi:MAG: hypothetical protein WB987_08630 [Candidatus Acidiferrales bacterium]